jgi:tRNA uridine 5-carboxymethylaminomethyl modification enzyme
MPGEVQLAALKTVSGLEKVEMIRPGYAVEYDMADPLQLTPTLMSKLADGLFLAGQLNGTSGYEEAAGQGIVAGINASLYAKGEDQRVFPRSESFIGVMIDDLVTKGVEDPYRMLTARAEHRLLLRHDNADMRLTPLGYSLGLASQSRWDRLKRKVEHMESGRAWLEEAFVTEAYNDVLRELGRDPAGGPCGSFSRGPTWACPRCAKQQKPAGWNGHLPSLERLLAQSQGPGSSWRSLPCMEAISRGRSRRQPWPRGWSTWRSLRALTTGI